MFRFSLATFLLIVPVASLVCAGLASPNLVWQQIVGTMMLVVFLVAGIAAISWQRTSRWFWLGFAVSGWTYLLITFYGGEPARTALLTDAALSRLDQILATSSPQLTPKGEQVLLFGDTVMVTGRGGTGYGMAGEMGGGNMDSAGAGGYGVATRQMSVEEAKQQGYMKYAYSTTTKPASNHFHDIGHYAWAFALACMGGTLSLWLRRRSATASA